jgi:hypothetical protein
MPLDVTLTVLVRVRPFESLKTTVHEPALRGVTVTVKGVRPDNGETCAIGFAPEHDVETFTVPPKPLSVATIWPASLVPVPLKLRSSGVRTRYGLTTDPSVFLEPQDHNSAAPHAKSAARLTNLTFIYNRT